MPLIDDLGKRVSWSDYVPGKPTIQRGSQNDPANWNLAGKPRTFGTKTPDQATLDMLRQGGWSVPTQATGTAPVPADSKYEWEGAPVELASYNYGITPEEWKRIRSNFEERLGYNKPANPAVVAPPPTPGNASYPFSNPGGDTPGVKTTSATFSESPEELLPTFTMEQTRARPLSYDSYLKLTPDQKAGVDLNALFVNAREKDLKETGKPTEEQRKIYDKDVMDLFGAGKGSEKFAPETVALVKQLNLNLPGWDLDQVLALDYALDVEDLEKFEISGARPKEIYGAGATGDVQRVYDLSRSEEAQKQSLIEAVRSSKAAIEKAMSNAFGVRGDVVSTMAAARKADVTGYGGTEMTIPKQTGFPLAYPNGIEPKGLTDEERGKDLFYTAAYEIIANKTRPMGDLWTEIANTPAATDPEQLNALFAYFDQRTRQEEQYGRPKGLGGANYRSPQEIREWIGLDK